MSLAVNEGLPDFVENFFSDSVTKKVGVIIFFFFLNLNPYTLFFLKIKHDKLYHFHK